MHKGNSNLEFILSVFLILLFTVLTFLSVQAASVTYEKASINTEAISEARIATSYIDNKIKQSIDGKVQILEIQDKNTFLIQINEEENFKTYIYYLNGYLNELYVSEMDNIDLTYGTNICKLENMEFKKINDDISKLEIFGLNNINHELIIKTGKW